MIEVDVSGPAVPRFPRREIAVFVRAVLKALPQSRGVGSVSVAFVDDAAMKTLNRRFRGKNRSTDVLTFPANDDDREPGAKTRPLGEIVISLAQAARQAREEGHSLATELRYLLLHGAIHALGYDHETDDGEMNALELRTRTKVGL